VPIEKLSYKLYTNSMKSSILKGWERFHTKCYLTTLISYETNRKANEFRSFK